MPSSEGNENSQKISEGLISQKKLCKCRTLFFLLEKKNNNFAHFFWYISCIEGRVRQPGTSGFCFRASEFCYNLSDGQVKFSEESKLKRNCEINLLIKTFLGLVEINDVWASKCQLQLARMAGCKCDFLCTLHCFAQLQHGFHKLPSYMFYSGNVVCVPVHFFLRFHSFSSWGPYALTFLTFLLPL